jgi:protein-disulfide isomerase
MRRAAALLTVALLMAPLAARAAQPTASPAPAAPPVAMPKPFTDPDYVIGDPRAKVTVIEYASASCPHCARFDAQVFPAFKAKYIATGKVKYVFREFLTPPEQVAAAGFLLGRCAGKSHYFHVVEQVFQAQPDIYKSDDPKAIFVRIAGDNGLSPAQMDACLTDQAAIDALDARVKQAVDVQKVDSTPSFFVNSVKLDEHGREPDLALFDAAIQPLLKKGR